MAPVRAMLLGIRAGAIRVAATYTLHCRHEWEVTNLELAALVVAIEAAGLCSTLCA